MRFHMVFYLVFLVFLVFLFGMIDFAGMPHDFSTDRASTDDHCRALPVPSRGASDAKHANMTTTAGRGEGSEARRASLRSSVQQEAGDPQHAAKSSATGQSSYSFARKRAYKRAVRRAGRDGFAHYRGRVMQPHELRARYVPNSSQNQGFPVQPVRRANGQAPASIRIMTWNCGGYSTLKDELYTWLDACDCDVVCLQETWLQDCMEFVAGDWTCVNCGTGPSKARGQAGVMILLRRSAFDSNTVRYNHVIGGRLLHVRAQCKAGWIDIVGVYMHAWAGKDKEQEIIAARSRVWTALRTTLGHIPKGNQLLLCGDFNSVLRPQQPFLGQGMGEKVTNFAADSSDFVSVLHDFDLLAVNTFGKRSNYTHTHSGWACAEIPLLPGLYSGPAQGHHSQSDLQNPC